MHGDATRKVRRTRWSALALLVVLGVAHASADDVLPSWNDGKARSAVIDFVARTTTAGSPDYVPAAERIAVFDQDGTLWVEQPVYAQLLYCLERVPALVKAKPELATQPPYSTVLQVLGGDAAAMGRLSTDDLKTIVAATLSGMPVEEFDRQVTDWLETAQDKRFQRRYTELIYQPMLELMQYLRSYGYRTYIVTGGGQDFVRTYSARVYGVPEEQVVGSAAETEFGYTADGKPVLTKTPKLLWLNDGGGKPEGIHLMIGQRPRAAFGNSGGDRQMLEYTRAGEGARLAMLVLHDDAEREYAYGPAQGLPDSKIGTFSQALYDQAVRDGWYVISMKNDWKQVFPADCKCRAPH